MLTEFQKQKLTHYFNILDYNNNDVIQKEDFVAIAENLCILWGLKPDTIEYDGWVEKFINQWREFKAHTNGPEENRAELEEWLDFADRKLVNGDDQYYEAYVEKMCEDIFDFFDEDGNGFISLNEFVDFFMAFRIEIRYSAKSFMKLDTNRDDRLSKQELLSAIRVFFRSPDENESGNWLFGFWED